MICRDSKHFKKFNHQPQNVGIMLCFELRLFAFRRQFKLEVFGGILALLPDKMSIIFHLCSDFDTFALIFDIASNPCTFMPVGSIELLPELSVRYVCAQESCVCARIRL